MITHPILGIMGVKQSGKDTLAAHLVNHYGFTRFALADPMREFALALDPLIPCGTDVFRDGVERLSAIVGHYGWDTAKEVFPEVRRTLQRLGTEAGRGVLGEDVWIEATRRLMAEVDGPIVITDIRFPNEYAWIKGLPDGHLVRVVRPGTNPGDHASEVMAQDVENYPANHTIFNDGSLDTFIRSECEYVGRTLTDRLF